MIARPVTKADIPAIQEAMRKTLEALKLRGKVYTNLKLNWDKGEDYLLAPDTNAFILNDQFLVILAITCPWYSDDVILSDDLIVRIHKGQSSMDDVIEFIEDTAKRNDIPMVSIGTVGVRDSSPYHKLLTNRGFQKESTQYFKELT